MSYRLISRALFSVTNSAGATLARELDVRAYPTPKREPVGVISVDGADAPYKRTGGKGRGVATLQYLYAPFRGESAYLLLTDAEAAALVGGSATLVAVATPAAPAAPEAVETKPVIAPEEAPATPVAKAMRRVKGVKTPA